MSAIIKYPEEIQKCLDIYEPYAIQIYEGKLEGVPQEAIDAYKTVKISQRKLAFSFAQNQEI